MTTRQGWASALDRMRDEGANEVAGYINPLRAFREGADSRRSQMLDLIEALENLTEPIVDDFESMARDALEKLKRELSL